MLLLIRRKNLILIRLLGLGVECGVNIHDAVGARDSGPARLSLGSDGTASDATAEERIVYAATAASTVLTSTKASKPT